MTLINYLINAYIDANILLICAFSIWSLARFILGRFGFSQAFGLQLRLLNSVFLAVAVSPFFGVAFDMLIETGTVSQSYAISLSDIVLAQYLNGGVCHATLAIGVFSESAQRNDVGACRL